MRATRGFMMMKAMIRATLLTGFAAGLLIASAGPAVSNAQPDEVGDWLNQWTLQAATEDIAAQSGGDRSRPGEYKVISIDDLDAPEAVKHRFRKQVSHDGVHQVPATELASVSSLLAQTGAQVLPLAVLRERLPAPPADLTETPLAQARLLATTSAGQRSGAKATGLSRLFSLNDVAVVEFTEESYRENKGLRISAFKEGLNAQVNGIAATRVVQYADNGRVCITLSWVTPQKSFELRLMAEDDVRRDTYVALLQQIADGIR